MSDVGLLSEIAYARVVRLVKMIIERDEAIRRCAPQERIGLVFSGHLEILRFLTCSNLCNYEILELVRRRSTLHAATLILTYCILRHFLAKMNFKELRLLKEKCNEILTKLYSIVGKYWSERKLVEPLLMREEYKSRMYDEADEHGRISFCLTLCADIFHDNMYTQVIEDHSIIEDYISLVKNMESFIISLSSSQRSS